MAPSPFTISCEFLTDLTQTEKSSYELQSKLLIDLIRIQYVSKNRYYKLLYFIYCVHKTCRNISSSFSKTYRHCMSKIMLQLQLCLVIPTCPSTGILMSIIHLPSFKPVILRLVLPALIRIVTQAILNYQMATYAYYVRYL